LLLAVKNNLRRGENKAHTLNLNALIRLYQFDNL
jgi:hypothetical protein